MTDPIQSAIQVALHGLSDRQHVTSNNLANVQTPGYTAQTTNFESNLTKALNGETVDLSPQRFNSLAPTNTNGNNVDIDNETVTAIDTELRFSAMVEAMNAKFTILKNSIGS